jgi:hypothetical protein
MQLDAFGPNDRRCQLTGNKIRMIEDGKLEAAHQAIPTLKKPREQVEKEKKPVALLRALNPIRKWTKASRNEGDVAQRE